MNVRRVIQLENLGVVFVGSLRERCLEVECIRAGIPLIHDGTAEAAQSPDVQMATDQGTHRRVQQHGVLRHQDNVDTVMPVSFKVLNRRRLL